MRVINFSSDNENLFDYQNSGWYSGSDNSSDRRKMARLLREALRNGLTDMQKQCITEYYGGKKQKQIAAEMGLNPSTVCRHIKAAKKRLQNITRYYK